MTDQQLLQRIALDPKVMVGKPVVRGTRLTVDFILEHLLEKLQHEFEESDEGA